MKILGCVGSGSFGKVFKVQVKGEVFAVKRVLLDFDCQEQNEQLISLRRQARLLNECLYHPNVIRCYSSFRKGDSFFIVMEYAGHISLNDLSFPLLGQHRILSLILQVGLGLKHLHSHNILHRDIKPQNVLVSPRGLLKITDLGISKKIYPQGSTNTSLGTPYYTAPQVINQQPYSFPADVWSFGVLIYECTHGILPYIGMDISQLKSQIKQKHPPIKEDLHQDIKFIIQGCLKKNPQKRIKIDQILNMPLVLDHSKEDIFNHFDFYP